MKFLLRLGLLSLLSLGLGPPLSQIVGKMLYGVAATDPATLATAPVVLALAALAACLLPVRRATSVNPVEALRAE